MFQPLYSFSISCMVLLPEASFHAAKSQNRAGPRRGCADVCGSRKVHTVLVCRSGVRRRSGNRFQAPRLHGNSLLALRPARAAARRTGVCGCVPICSVNVGYCRGTCGVSVCPPASEGHAHTNRRRRTWKKVFLAKRVQRCVIRQAHPARLLLRMACRMAANRDR